ncbi:hypothetical protein BO443_60210 [Burkholderia orbicola]
MFKLPMRIWPKYHVCHRFSSDVMVFFDTAGVESVVMQTADGGLRRGSRGTKSCRGRRRSRLDATR